MDENEPDCDRCNDTGQVYYGYKIWWWWTWDKELSPCPDCNEDD